MKKLRAVIVLLLGIAAGLPAEIVSVAAYNVENFNLSDRMVEGVFRQNYPKPESEKAALVEVITAAAPDVLVMEEMGGEEYLAELQTRLKAAGAEYPYANLTQAVDSVRHVAVLSKKKFAVKHFNWLTFNYEGKRERVLRGLMQVEFVSAEGVRWRVYGVHLKSRHSENEWDEDSEKFRVGEATAVREQILKNEGEATAYLVMGDFNDGPRSSAVKRFLAKGSRTLTWMLPLVDSRGEEWTHHWKTQGSFSQIDYILASPVMARAVVPGSARIVDIPEAAEASDHRMVFVKIDTEKFSGRAGFSSSVEKQGGGK